MSNLRLAREKKVMNPLPSKTYSQLESMCRSQGGRVVHGNTRDSDKKMLFECDSKHQWRAIPYNLLKGSWCPHPECRNPRISSGRAARTLKAQTDKVEECVRKKGGQWLNPPYTNNHTKLELKCSRGHLFKSIPYAILAGSWCPTCVGKKDAQEHLKDLKTLAFKRGGRLISTEYKSARSNLIWECSKFHQWKAAPDSVKNRGTWCPFCAQNSPIDIEELKRELSGIADSHRGQILNIKKTSLRGPLRYEIVTRCEFGHIWKPKLDSLRRGSWCPTCNTPGVKEKVCKAILEWLTGESFPKTRPDWLRNDRGNKMELDGYSAKLKLAFEYQGEQHARFVKFFHENADDFERRRLDDKHKKSLCKQHGIDLLVVGIEIPIDQLQEYLAIRLIELRPELEGLLNETKFPVGSVPHRRSELINHLKELARSRGGECLSKTYQLDETKLKWRCANSHIWEARASSVRQGTWCRICSFEEAHKPRREASDTEARKLCTELKLRLLKIDEMVNKKRRYKVECSAGHTWLTDLGRLKKGHACQICSAQKAGERLKLSIDDLEQNAAERGGTLLSKTYKNSSVRLLWRCKKRHLWLATPNSVRRGSWCPVCSGKSNFAFKGSVEEFLRNEQK